MAKVLSQDQSRVVPQLILRRIIDDCHRYSWDFRAINPDLSGVISGVKMKRAALSAK
jgi:hypothetical protein